MNTTNRYIFHGPDGSFDIRTITRAEQEAWLREANNAGDREAVLVLHEVLGLPLPEFAVQEQAERIAKFVGGDDAEDAAWKVLSNGGTYEQAVLAAKKSRLRTITDGDTVWEYDPAHLVDTMWVQVQPHQGPQDSYLDDMEGIVRRCHEWLSSYPGDWTDEHDEMWESLENGDPIPALAYDKQWAKITPLTDLDDAGLLRIAAKLERANFFLNVTDDDN